MTTATLPLAATRKTTGGFDIGPAKRIGVALVGGLLTTLALLAIGRGLLGFAPAHPNVRELAIVIHIATVLPAIPLGAFLLLTRKGGKRHKQLGKLWIGLMVTTAASAIFIKTSGSFSFIHIFVPVTLWSSYKVIASARRGDIATHKKEILGLFFGALTIPGIVAFALPGRLMNVWLFGWPAM